jgi:hypothetical protein
MLKLFRHIRKNLLNEGKNTKYFKYAIGEIVLVVIGILIALSINNWNEDRKDQTKLLNIYRLIHDDIENDIEELQTNVDFFNKKKAVFEKVVHDSITPDLLDQGLSSLLFKSPRTLLNKKGVSQLAELQENNRLTFYLYDIYEFMETNILPLENRISKEMIDHKKYVRDNYDWYPEWINNPITKNVGDQEMHNYFLTNSTYRNRVVFIYDQVYNNYVLTLKALIKSLTIFKGQISEILKKTDD